MTNKNQCSVEERGSGSAVASQNLAIVTFENPIFGTIRTAGTADEPLFCLADICRVLELQTNKVKDRLKQDGWNSIPLTDKLGRGQLATFINEQNLYRLVMRSDKPQAEPFQDWVCGEVLPQIRRTGGYIPVSAEDDDLTVMAKALQIMQRTLEEKDKLIADKSVTIGRQEKQIRLLAPKANAFDQITRSDTCYTATQLAKEFGYPNARAFYDKLIEQKIVFRQSNSYLPYKYWANKGLFSYRTHTVERSDGRIETHTYLVFTEKFRTLILRSRHRRAMENL